MKLDYISVLEIEQNLQCIKINSIIKVILFNCNQALHTERFCTIQRDTQTKCFYKLKAETFYAYNNILEL
jgi:hypothetical protein